MKSSAELLRFITKIKDPKISIGAIRENIASIKTTENLLDFVKVIDDISVLAEIFIPEKTRLIDSKIVLAMVKLAHKKQNLAFIELLEPRLEYRPGLNIVLKLLASNMTLVSNVALIIKAYPRYEGIIFSIFCVYKGTVSLDDLQHFLPNYNLQDYLTIIINENNLIKGYPDLYRISKINYYLCISLIKSNQKYLNYLTENSRNIADFLTTFSWNETEKIVEVFDLASRSIINFQTFNQFIKHLPNFTLEVFLTRETLSPNIRKLIDALDESQFFELLANNAQHAKIIYLQSISLQDRARDPSFILRIKAVNPVVADFICFNHNRSSINAAIQITESAQGSSTYPHMLIRNILSKWLNIHTVLTNTAEIDKFENNFIKQIKQFIARHPVNVNYPIIISTLIDYLINPNMELSEKFINIFYPIFQIHFHEKYLASYAKQADITAKTLNSSLKEKKSTLKPPKKFISHTNDFSDNDLCKFLRNDFFEPFLQNKGIYLLCLIIMTIESMPIQYFDEADNLLPEILKIIKANKTPDNKLISQIFTRINTVIFHMNGTLNMLNILTQTWSEIDISNLKNPGLNTAAFILSALNYLNNCPKQLMLFYVKKYRCIKPSDDQAYDMLTEDLLHDFQLGHLTDWRDTNSKSLVLKTPSHIQPRFSSIKDDEENLVPAIRNLQM